MGGLCQYKKKPEENEIIIPQRKDIESSIGKDNSGIANERQGKPNEEIKGGSFTGDKYDEIIMRIIPKNEETAVLLIILYTSKLEGKIFIGPIYFQYGASGRQNSFCRK